MKILSLVRTVALSALIALPSLALAQNPDDPAAATTTTTAVKGRGGHRHHAYLANLTPAERKQLHAAHARAKQDPAYQAAKGRMKEARQAMRAALLKADPNIQPILNKASEGGRHRDS